MAALNPGRPDLTAERKQDPHYRRFLDALAKLVKGKIEREQAKRETLAS